MEPQINRMNADNKTDEDELDGKSCVFHHSSICVYPVYLWFIFLFRIKAKPSRTAPAPSLASLPFDSARPLRPSPCGHVAPLPSKLPTSLQQFCGNYFLKCVLLNTFILKDDFRYGFKVACPPPRPAAAGVKISRNSVA